MSNQKVAVLMSIEQIRNGVRAELITFGPHLVERMFQNGISIDQVCDVILNGSVRIFSIFRGKEVRLFGKSRTSFRSTPLY